MANKFIRENEATDITGLSRATRWRLEKRGEFPSRYQISDGISAYKESEVMKWLESRPLEV
jgi:prophage regulatory protein